MYAKEVIKFESDKYLIHCERIVSLVDNKVLTGFLLFAYLCSKKPF